MIKGRKIIIWGKDNYNVLGLLRQLKDFQNQIVLLIVGKRQNCATLSKYCHNKIFVKDVQTGYEYLINNINNETVKPIIIPANDLVAECIDCHQEILSKKYLFSFTEEKLLSKYLDKMIMHEIAESCGINTPKSYYLYDDIHAEKVGFPCIIKPIKKINGVAQQFKFTVCEDKNALKQVVDSIDDFNNYLIQEYIEKECDYLVYGCRNLNGDVVMPCVFKKERWYNGDGSYGQLQSVIPSFISREGIIKFLDITNYHGLFSFEYGISNGKSYYYETNFRNDGTSHYFYQAGVNLPLYWVLNLCEKKETNTCIKPFNSKIFIDEIYDSSNVKSKVVKKKTWRKEKKAASVYKYYDRKDPLPYFYQVIFYFAYKVYSLFK